MPSKQQDVAQPTVSPVLFMTVDGEPMSFFLRPGPVKRKLQPLITAGGGILCSVQQPGAILLIDPEERSSVPESAAHRYVSTQYIQDCIEKDEQLNLEDYRLNPDVVQRQSPRLNSGKGSSPGLLGGRVAYTSEEDAAILNYVSKHKTEIGGNRLWQEMEKQLVTHHSWQSMKYRYRVRLAKKQSEVVEVEAAQEDNKVEEEENMEVEENRETDVQKPSREEDVVPPQTPSAETDLTQIDAETTPAESTTEDVDAQTSVSLSEEQQSGNQQTEEEPAETVEAETSHSSEPGELSEELQADSQLLTAETTQPERDAPQTAADSQLTQSLPEDSPPAQPESPLKASSSKRPKEKQQASTDPGEPQRRVTRRQLELEASSYGKKLRSSSSTTSSPQPSKKTKSAVKSDLQKDTMTEQPPSKRARGRSVAAAAESQQEHTEPAVVPETPQAEESNLEPENAETTKEKRQVGILELATKEFEDDSESGDEEALDVPNPVETAATSTEPLPPPSDASAAPQSSPPEPSPTLQENVREARATAGTNCVPETSRPEPAEPAVSEPAVSGPAVSEPAVSEPAVSGPAVSGPAVSGPAVSEPAVSEPAVSGPAVSGPAVSEPAVSEPAVSEPAVSEPAVSGPAVSGPAVSEPAVSATSKAHLFIFDSESQEEDSQPNPEPMRNSDAGLSLTRDQLEEDKQRIRDLMKQTNQDLESVTVALLKTSGDFSAALNLLSNPSSVSGPFWNRSDDGLLVSADPVVRQTLQEKYSEESVAKRIVFLEVEG